MGAVYRARQVSLNRFVAIKLLPSDLISDGESHFAARFRQEALTMAKLSHPGIVSVFECGEAGGLLYIVMEFVAGADVARLIKEAGRLAPDFASALVTQVCEALQYAHDNGVVHRDIKPSNLLVTREGAVKIADFGLAKHTDVYSPDLTRTNVAIGTPDYLAPEAMMPGAALDRRSDLYSLGVSLYQMLTGEVPRGLWKMPSVKAGVDPRFDVIISRAMEPERDSRYQSSVEIIRDLAAIKDGPPPTSAPPRESRPPGRPPRKTATIAAAIALVVLAAGVWVYLLWNRTPSGWRQVVSFDEAQGYIAVPHFGDIAPTNEATVEFWAYAHEIGPHSIFSMEPDLAGNRFQSAANFSDGSMDWDFGAMTPSGRLQARQARGSINNWVHYALVVSRVQDSMRIYKDGELYASKTHCSSFGRGSYELRIGGNSMTFSGRLAEFRIWNTARSAEEIRANFRRTLSGREANLLLYYRLDEGSGAVAANRAAATGPAYNGRLTNGPGWKLVAQPAPQSDETSPAREWVVTSIADEGSGSLREAMAGAEQVSKITFAQNLSGQTIHLSREIFSEKEVTIDASALPRGIRIDADGSHGRIFNFHSRDKVTLKSLTLARGAADEGGAISSSASLTMVDCALSGNHAGSQGGAIYAYAGASISMTGCTLEGNEAGTGGGICANMYVPCSFTNCTFVANRAHVSGGALSLEQSQADIAACTFFGNIADTGQGGGLYGNRIAVTLINNIIAGNSAPSDANYGFRDIVEFVAGNNLTNGVPMLAPLGEYGGRTRTMPPLQGSPAVGAGGPGGPATDQRNVARLAGSPVDLGAVQGFAAP